MESRVAAVLLARGTSDLLIEVASAIGSVRLAFLTVGNPASGQSRHAMRLKGYDGSPNLATRLLQRPGRPVNLYRPKTVRNLTARLLRRTR